MVFRDLNIALGVGEALLVTGANGSGKSSLLRVLAGFLPRLQGAIHWQGIPIDDDPDLYRRSLCYLGHLDAVKQELTVAENLEYWRTLCCIHSGTWRPADDPFGIFPLRDRPARYLSAGQKRRLALTRIVSSTATLWLLDEPATALDSAGQDILLNCIARHRAGGGIVVIATHHDMPLANAVRHEMKAQGHR